MMGRFLRLARRPSSSRLRSSTLTRRSSRPGACACTAARATATASPRRWRVNAHAVVGIGVDGLVSNAVPVFVHPSHRLLKQAWLRISLRDGTFQDIKLVFV